MISLVKIVSEGYAFDADDYVPYNNLKVNDIVRFVDNEEEQYKILSIEGDGKLIISLVDDPRDIKAVFYDDDVIAHESDQEDDTAEEDSVDLNETDEAEDLSPESILRSYEEVIGKGEGFNVADIEEALRNSFNDQQDSYLGRDLRYAYLDIENTPAKNSVSTIEFNETGKYGSEFFGEQKCLTLPEAAAQVEQKLKTGCEPEELCQHIKGWMVVKSKYRPGLYPLLDEEGVRIYKEAEQNLTKAINDFYKGSTYWGD